MKESDAITRWCPYVGLIQQPVTQTTPQKQTLAIPERMASKALDPNTLCLGSRCMAWRVSLEAAESEDGTAHGYCGFAWAGA